MCLIVSLVLMLEYLFQKMVIVCTYRTCGVRVIVSNNYQNDHAQLVNGVLGMPHYERDLTQKKGESDKELRRLDDLVDKFDECDMEEAPPNADDLFAYEFFKKTDLLRNARVYAGNDQLQGKLIVAGTTTKK